MLSTLGSYRESKKYKHDVHDRIYDIALLFGLLTRSFGESK